jgi:hypothetical protein
MTSRSELRASDSFLSRFLQALRFALAVCAA